MAISEIPQEMTAVQVIKFHEPYKIHQVPTPQASDLQDREMLLKTAVASLCHTDGMVVDHKFPTKLPCTASHEGTGVVVAVGPKVTKFKKGDRIMSGIFRYPCTVCENCTGPGEWQAYCTSTEINGCTISGAFADYHVVDERTSALVPKEVSFTDAAPLACAGITVYRAIIVSEVQKGQWIALVGAGGGLGHLGIQFALAKGLNVIAVDARDEGLEVCKKYGAKHVVDARKDKEEVVKQVQELTGGKGADATVNLSDHKSAAAIACAITKMHGRMIQVAQPDEVSIPFQEIVFRDIRVVGSLVSSQEQAQQMLTDVAEHDIKVETNVFHGLNEVPKMVELAHSGKMKGKPVCIVDEELMK